MSAPMSETWGRFFAWAVAGVVVGFGMVSFPTLALVVLVIAGIAVVMQPGIRRSGVGLVAGIGALFLFVAFVQRRGPGTVCWETASASGCDEYLNPLPWLVVGAALVAVAVRVQLRYRREARLGSREA